MKEDICAVLDFGSNTVTLAVYRLNPRGLRTLFKRKIALGIIRYQKGGMLTEEGIGRAVAVLHDLKLKAEPMTACVHCFATASLRGVGNAPYAIGRIREEAGIDIKLLSGEEEARCDYLGLMRYFPDVRSAVALDIGGGSIEILHIRSGRLAHCVSLPTGSLKLSIDYAGGRSPGPDERLKIEQRIEELLDGIEWLREAASDTLFTIGGTARAAAKLHRAIFSYSVDARDYTYPVSDLGPLLLYLEDESHYRRLEQLIPDRMQTIVPGLIALRAVAKRTRVTMAVLSKYGVREGYLLSKTPLEKEA